MKKFLIGVALVVLAGIAVIVTAVSLAGRDRPVPDVADLAVERIALPPEDNAYPFFASATNVLHWPSNGTPVTDYLDGKTFDAAAVADILDRNAQTFELIKRGVVRKKCIAPEGTVFDASLRHMRPWLNMGRCLAARTRSCRLSGRYSDAAESCVSLLRFGDMVQQDPERLIQYLVGLAIMNLGLTQAQELARDKNLPMAELSRLSVALAELSPCAPALVRALKIEYKVVANRVDLCRDGKCGMAELAGLSGDRPHSLLKTVRYRSTNCER